MSTLASLYLLARKDIPELAEARRANRESDFLHSAGTLIEERYGWSGMCMLALIDLLQDNGVPIHTGPTDLLAMLTADHQQYLDRFDPALYDVGEIHRHFRLFSTDFDKADLAARDGILLLRRQIERLGPEEVLVVDIG